MTQEFGFSHLSKAFGAQAVFSDFSLSLPIKTTVCLMGPSGCGKTTLLRLLMGLEQPDSGRVHSIHPQSVVFQEDRLLGKLTAQGNLRLVGGRGCEGRANRLLSRLGLGQEGTKPVKEFSGGMKRRVAIARALLVPYELLLLDEPFKGLDIEARQRAAQVILEEARGKTILLVTHDPEEARLMQAQMIQLDVIAPK